MDLCHCWKLYFACMHGLICIFACMHGATDWYHSSLFSGYTHSVVWTLHICTRACMGNTVHNTVRVGMQKPAAINYITFFLDWEHHACIANQMRPMTVYSRLNLPHACMHTWVHKQLFSRAEDPFCVNWPITTTHVHLSMSIPSPTGRYKNVKSLDISDTAPYRGGGGGGGWGWGGGLTLIGAFYKVNNLSCSFSCSDTMH